MAHLHRWVDTIWYTKKPWFVFLLPFTAVYRIASALRKWVLCRFMQTTFPVPVIVVGNVSVGGVGKTPLVMALVKALQEKGLRVGVVSRGYGAARTTSFPFVVTPDAKPDACGDEPLLIARRTGVPVVISPRRVDAVTYVLNHHAVDVIISDDGLQHYAMGRAMEIIVSDGMRGFGNGHCLPAGPLREGRHRIQSADMWVVNGGHEDHAFSMSLIAHALRQVVNDEPVSLSTLPSPVAAVAGIGHPQRFFDTLNQLGIAMTPYAFPDHFKFTPNDLKVAEAAVVMTEKDAVKCKAFACESWYYLPIEAHLEDAFWSTFWSHPCLKGLMSP